MVRPPYDDDEILPKFKLPGNRWDFSGVELSTRPTTTPAQQQLKSATYVPAALLWYVAENVNKENGKSCTSNVRVYDIIRVENCFVLKVESCWVFCGVYTACTEGREKGILVEMRCLSGENVMKPWKSVDNLYAVHVQGIQVSKFQSAEISFPLQYTEYVCVAFFNWKKMQQLPCAHNGKPCTVRIKI